MKTKQILLVYGACFVLLPTLKAQEIAAENTGYNDTIVIQLEGSDKVLFIGSEMKEMVEYKKADSLKMLFLNDWKKALETQQLNGDETHVHYFIHNSGKRRMKAENVAYNDRDVNPAAEIKRLNLDLPPYEYIWYDISSGFRWEIYTSDPEKLRQELEKVSLDVAVQQMAQNKRDARQYYKAEISTTGASYQVVNKVRNRKDLIEVVPMAGLGLIGNIPAPGAGFDILLRMGDKYGGGMLAFGASMRTHSIVHIANKEISGMEAVTFYSGQFRFNVEAFTKRESWFGISGGPIYNYGGLLYHKTWSVGLTYNNGGHVHYIFDIINIGRQSATYGFSVFFSL